MLLYPIIQKGVVEKIKSDSFSVGDNLSAGPYIFEKREGDDKTNSEKVSVVRNEKNTNNTIYIGRYVFRFFHDKNELLASKDNLNIVFPDKTIESLSSPRFEQFRFILPEYISLFLNADKIGPELRSSLLGSLSKVQFSSLDAETGRLLKNPFFTDESILPETFDAAKIESIMKNIGFFKKEALLVELSKGKTETKTISEGTNSYFTSPSNKKYAVTQETDILLS